MMISPTLQEKLETRRHCIDLSYGFFAVMGGFKADTSDMHETQKPLVLPDEMLSVLLEPEADAVISEREAVKMLLVDTNTIKDRSKASNITKALICVQVLGVAAQCLARKIVGLPLTLLEIHTFAHVVCAICIYVTWFQKPLDVNESITIALPDELRPSLAQTLQRDYEKRWCCEISHSCGRGVVHAPMRESTLKSYSEQGPYHSSPGHYITDLDIPISTHPDEQCEQNCMVLDDEPHHVVAICLEHQTPPFLRISEPRYPVPVCQCIQQKNCTMRLTPSFDQFDLVRLRTAVSCPNGVRERLKSYRGRIRNYVQVCDKRDRDPWYPDPGLMGKLYDFLDLAGFCGTEGNFLRSLASCAVACVIVAGYAAVHASAWNASFSSSVERQLWHLSCLVLVGSYPLGVFIFRILSVVESFEKTDTCLIRPMQRSICAPISGLIGPLAHFLFWFLWLMTVLLFIVYPLARVYIVLETLVSLRSVPQGIYTTVPWTHYIPHI